LEPPAKIRSFVANTVRSAWVENGCTTAPVEGFRPTRFR
jgi:hypothetical protein